MVGRSIPLALALLAGGCLSTHARRAMRANDYQEAAVLYGKAYQRSHRPAIRVKRDEARTLAIGAALDDSDALRAKGRDKPARQALDDLLRISGRWGRPFSPTEQARVDELVAWAAEGDHRQSLAALAQGRPLDAVRILPERLGLRRHPAYAEVRREVKASILALGGRRCGELHSATADRARVPDLISLYCRAFGATAGPVHHEVANACDQVEVVYAEGNLPVAEQRGLEAEIGALLRRTPYLHPRGHCTIQVRVSASRGTKTTTAITTVTAPWMESVPYTARVSKIEHYTEMEPRMETRYVSEPYTTTEYESSTCGYGDHTYTCSKPRTVTSYRRVAKTETRQVMVHKTRQVWVNETRYRDEPRTFEYPALAVTHAFEGIGALTARVGEHGVAITVPWSSAHRTSGYDHDTTFAPADVVPSSVPPPSRTSLVERDTEALRGAWRRTVSPLVVAQFCRPGDDPDRAVACLLYAGSKAVPRTGREALAAVVGESYASVAWLVERSRPRSPRRPR
ncbi:MAG: hypothetical protein K0V04_17910 [Deltaproteobacteria bacterium]|nr:hypothetical protein [Deltaproteobacteria bacterium]